MDANADTYTLTSTVGPLHIYGQLGLHDASGHTGLYVDCPLVIEDGGSILVDSVYNSTGITFNGLVSFTAGGQITAYGPGQYDLFQTGNNLNFNAGIVCTNDLSVTSEGGSADAHINLTDLRVFGDVYCHAGLLDTASVDQSTINLAGTNDNFVLGTLFLDADVGTFYFSKPPNTRVANFIDVHPVEGEPASLTVPIHLNNPGNFGAASTLVVEQAVQVNLSGASPVMGTVVLKHQSADAAATVLNVGSTVPEFSPLSIISVIQDGTQGTPQIQGNIRLDGTQIDVNGAVPSFLEIDGSIQGSGFNKTGPGTLLLNGANNLSGAVTVSGGTLQAPNTAALNITSGGSLHLNGGTLWAEYVNLPNTPLFVDGPLSEVLAYTPCAWGGPVTLNSTLTVAPIDLHGTNAAINFSGPISGPGGLFLQNAFFGTGAVQLSGPSANTFTGPITDECQLLEFNKPAGVSAFGGPLIAGGPGGVELGEVRWLNSRQAPQPNLTLYSNCIVNLNNFNQDFYGITFNGGRIESGNGQLGFYASVTVNPVGVTASIDGFVGLPQGEAVFDVGAGGVDPDLLVSAAISGTTLAVIKTGPGILRFDGANTYSGVTDVNQGILEVGNADGLGYAGNSANVAAGANLQTEPGAAVANPINLAGGLTVPAGQSVILTGSIFLQNPTTINVAGNLLIDAPINGNGGLTKTGAGNLTLGGNVANTYTGDTQVSGGTLTLGKPNNVNAVPGNLNIGSSGLHSTPSTVAQAGNNLIGGSVTVNGGSLWDLQGHLHTFSTSLNGNLPLALVNGGSVQTGATGWISFPGGDDVKVIPGSFGSSTIGGALVIPPGPNNFIIGQRSATISGPECVLSANIYEVAGAGLTAQLIKSSPGTLVLTGTNSYQGNTIVSSGTLEIDGSQPQSLVQVYAATLQGHGTLGPLELDDPNAVVAPIGLPSTLVCNNFNQGATPNGTLQIYLAGNQPGTGYSQVVANGAVNLANLNLNASLDFYSAYGDRFTILKNNGPGPVAGAFNGLPEGTILTISGEPFQITYLGGSGGDVVLEHLSPATPAHVVTWINNSGGTWTTAANWSTGTVPNGGNAVVAVNTFCTITNNASVSLDQLFFNSPQCAITGSGTFALNGLLDWQAGSFNGSGSLTANGGLHLDAPSGNLSLTGDSLVNSAAATWSGSTAIILSGGAVLSNTPSGTFDCAGDGTIQNGPGSNLLANAGLFRKISGTGTTTIQVPFNHSGTVQLQSGSLSLAGGGSSSGHYEVSSGASLIFSAGVNTATASSVITGAGDFHVTGGTANLLGSVTTLGAHLFSGGIVNLGDNYHPANNDLSIGACAVNFDGVDPITAASLTVGGYGSLGGSSLVMVSGPMTWNSGFAITGSNSVIANGGLTISSGGESLIGRTLVNMASGLWTNDVNHSFVLGSGAVLSNAPGATFDCVGSSTIGPTTGSGTVANGGLFRTIGAPATTLVQVPFNNNGTVEVQSGTLSLSGGGTNLGAIDVFANATLSLGGGFTLAPGASITGPGQLLLTSAPAAADLAGTVSLSGSNMFGFGVANLTGNYVCSNAPVSIVAGTANFNGSNVISPSSLTLGSYGSLGGSNLVTVSGPMIWGGGSSITATGSVLANGGLTIGPGDVSLIGSTLVNLASGLWTNNVNHGFVLGSGAVLSNVPGATFDCVGSSTIGGGTGGGLVANGGLFRLTGAPGTTRIEAPFINYAVVEVQSGTLSLAGGGSCIGASNSIAEIAVSAGALLDFSGGTFSLDPAAIIDGMGNLSVSGATANLAGTVVLGGTHTFSGGTANLTGDYECISNALVIAGGTANFNGHGAVAPATLTLGSYGTLGGSNLVTVSGPMIWGGGSSITGTGSVLANGGLTIGPGDVSLIGRTLVNLASGLWTNNVNHGFVLGSGAVLSNVPGATFDCVGSGTIGPTAGGGLVANGGLFRTIGAPATTTVSVPFINNGTVELDAGTLYFQGGDYTQTSGTTYLNGGNLATTSPLQIMGGVMKGSGLISGSLTNAGLLQPGSPAGQIMVSGAYTQTPAGSLDIVLSGPNPLTGFNRLVVSNSAQLAGALTVSLANGFAPVVGGEFQILSSPGAGGAFTTLNVPAGLSVTYSNNGVFLVVTSAVSAPAILESPQVSGGHFRFSLPTVPNQSYTIQENTDVSTTNWMSVTNFIGDGSLFQFLAPPPTSPQNFFRVRQP